MENFWKEFLPSYFTKLHSAITSVEEAPLPIQSFRKHLKLPTLCKDNLGTKSCDFSNR